MSDKNSNHDDDASLSERFRSAGPRPSIPPDELDALRDVAKGVWSQRYGRKRRRHRQWLAAAAVLTLVVLGWWLVPRTPREASAVVVARVDASRGMAGLSTGQELLAGTEIETSRDAWVSLILAGGQSLRLNERTRITLTEVGAVLFERGAVYVDSQHGAPITIETTAGEISPVGTQFEVRVVDGSVHLRVREGRVALKRDSGPEPEIVHAGQQLSIRPDGALHLTAIARSGSEWDWILAVIRIPEIDGSSLDGFVTWIARERGWDVAYATSDAAAVSRETILYGSVGGMTPDDALSTVMLSSGFSYEVSDGTLRISRR